MKQFVPLLLIVVLGFSFSACSLFKRKTPTKQSDSTKKIQLPVNQIPINKRPYVELVPQNSRNKLNLVIHERPEEADSVEVTLEYDRNEGVLDAVLKDISLVKPTQTEELFLGSKSAGGHITYHDDVIGGNLKLDFTGKNEYLLEVPWRYDDKQTQYEQFATTDGKFQINFEQPWKTSKIIAMQSPGHPEGLKGEVIAGPFLVRGVGQLPEINTKLTIHLNSDVSSPNLLGYDGQEWQPISSNLQGKSLTASSPLYELFVVTQ